MKKQFVKISKFLSLVLRHKPEKIGLSLDMHGWADVDELIVKANYAGFGLDRDLIEKVVKQNDKKRFSFSDDGLKIRANQGHSIPIDLGLKERKPPAVLYHGTANRFPGSIREKGLLRGKRHHVHLSSDENTALAVGKRYGKPVVLEIQAGRMFEEGYTFFLSENGVWLTGLVPVDYIRFPFLFLDQREQM